VICIVRERRRDGKPWEDQEVGAIELLCFREFSGKGIFDVTGLELTALEEVELGIDFSHGMVFCLRKDAGLSEDAEVDAVRRPGDEAQ
jgi:hypothetical protein